MIPWGQRSTGEGIQHGDTHTAVGWNCSDQSYMVEGLEFKPSAPKSWTYEAWKTM